MASVRIPESAKVMLPYCNTNSIKYDDFFFSSFAHLLVFAASVGYMKDEFDDIVPFCEKEPYPISIDIFKNAHLFDYILIIGLAKTKNYEVINDEDALCKIVEGYSNAGFREMLNVYERCSGHNFLNEWVQQIVTFEN